MNNTNEKSGVRAGLFLFYFPLLLTVVMTSCSCHHRDDPNATVTTVSKDAQGSGLNLQALGDLVRKSPGPAALEKTLNTPGSINNLDLDHDGKVDYIKVSEASGDGNTKILKLTDEAVKAAKTEVATVAINRSSDTEAKMNISGNQTLYGGNSNYQSAFLVGGSLLMGYLLAPHQSYSSPYGPGAYPRDYQPSAPVSADTYHRMTASPASKPLTATKEFTVRNGTQAASSGGFGSHSSTGASSPASPQPSASPSHTRSFGKPKKY